MGAICTVRAGGVSSRPLTKWLHYRHARCPKRPRSHIIIVGLLLSNPFCEFGQVLNSPWAHFGPRAPTSLNHSAPIYGTWISKLASVV